MQEIGQFGSGAAVQAVQHTQAGGSSAAPWMLDTSKSGVSVPAACTGQDRCEGYCIIHLHHMCGQHDPLDTSAQWGDATGHGEAAVTDETGEAS